VNYLICFLFDVLDAILSAKLLEAENQTDGDGS